MGRETTYQRVKGRINETNAVELNVDYIEIVALEKFDTI